jgi:enamine deaminase RidA (YjgF/YER057c/UK114 family)
LSTKPQVVHTPMSRAPGFELSVPAMIVEPGRLMFIQGQAALSGERCDPIPSEMGFSTTPEMAVVGDTVTEQTHQIFKNLTEVLAVAGGELSDVVHMIIFIRDMEYFGDFFEVRKEYYPEGVFPPATGVETTRLADPRLLIEIHATAALGS